MKLLVEEGGVRADRFVTDQLPGRSRRQVTRAFDEGQVRVNGKRAAKGLLLAAGDVVELAAVPPAADELRPVAEPELPLDLLHEDAALVAVAKPAGMASHPLRAGERGTLASALVASYPECARLGADPREAGLVHRLDALTSGVLVAARTADAWRTLREAFHAGLVDKEYLALVEGTVTAPGVVDAPIAHDSADRRRVRVWADPGEAIRRGALDAETRFEPVRAAAGGATVVRCTGNTGRMHQIRAHLAFAGHPLVGDALYGATTSGQVLLHAGRLALPHPATGDRLVLVAPPPASLA